jgi:hypothetical protein
MTDDWRLFLTIVGALFGAVAVYGLSLIVHGLYRCLGKTPP